MKLFSPTLPRSTTCQTLLSPSSLGADSWWSIGLRGAGTLLRCVEAPHDVMLVNFELGPIKVQDPQLPWQCHACGALFGTLGGMIAHAHLVHGRRRDAVPYGNMEGVRTCCFKRFHCRA
eukprot:15445666-Alexandrium_andersonii.AAC.1